MGDVTHMLVAASAGDKHALDAILPLVYNELRRIAARFLARERPDHTLQPTALVNEAYLKLVKQESVDWQNRAQFYGIAAGMMRRILVDHAVARGAEKRGGEMERITLTNLAVFPDEPDLDLLALDQALTRLGAMDADKAKLVELKFFGGLTMEEISLHLDKPVSTVEKHWKFARAWLYTALKETK